MELILNLAWMLLATLLATQWLRHGCKHTCCHGVDRRVQLIALSVVLLLLFPVISVSDDLLMAQNPAETAICAQKNCSCAIHHQHAPSMASLPQTPMQIDSFERIALLLTSAPLDSATQNPSLRRVDNRPPPAFI